MNMQDAEPETARIVSPPANQVRSTGRSRGEMEAAICHAVTQFQQEYMGRGPRNALARLVDDTLFVRLDGVLTAAEQRLVDMRAEDNGRGAEIVRQFRSHLVALARPKLEAVVGEITGTNPSACTMI